MRDKTPMCNRSIILKLESTTLGFVFSDKQHRPIYRTTFQHLHSSFELHFVISGTCRLKTDEREWLLSANTAVIIPPKKPHLITDYSQDCNKVDVRVSVVGDEGIENDPLPFSTSEVTVVENVRKTAMYAAEFFESMIYSGREGEIITKSALALAYFSLLREMGLAEDDGTVKRESLSLSYDYVIIEDCLMQNYMSSITLREVAEKTGFTPTHIGRVIKKNYGMSYSELILTMRMSHARKLIESGEPVADIAKMVGFSSYNGFALAFKRYYKISPEKMRKELNLK
jgi:AraC-like DNA-binding protein